MAPEECGVKLWQSCCGLKKEAVICTSAALSTCYFPVWEEPQQLLPGAWSPPFPFLQAPLLGNTAMLPGETVASVALIASASAWALQSLQMPLFILKRSVKCSKLAKGLQGPRRSVTAYLAFVWTEPAPGDCYGWCSLWFCLYWYDILLGCIL